MYTGYGYRPAFIVGALFDNPRTGYSEQIIGIGGRATLPGGGSQFVVAAVAKAPESRYLQFYYVPSMSYRRLTLGTTIETYVPLVAVPGAELGADVLIGIGQFGDKVCLSFCAFS